MTGSSGGYRRKEKRRKEPRSRRQKNWTLLAFKASGRKSCAPDDDFRFLDDLYAVPSTGESDDGCILLLDPKNARCIFYVHIDRLLVHICAFDPVHIGLLLFAKRTTVWRARWRNGSTRKRRQGTRSRESCGCLAFESMAIHRVRARSMRRPRARAIGCTHLETRLKYRY